MIDSLSLADCICVFLSSAENLDIFAASCAYCRSLVAAELMRSTWVVVQAAIGFKRSLHVDYLIR